MQHTPEQIFAHASECMKLGNFSEAERAFRETLSFAPTHSQTLVNLAALILTKNDHVEAEKLLHRALAEQPTVEAISLLTKVLADTGRIDDAIERYRQLVMALPDDMTVRKNMADLYDRAGHRKLARAEWDVIRKTFPDDYGAAINYATHSWRDDPTETIRVLETLPVNIQTLTELVVYREWWERMQVGKMPYHAESLDDMRFQGPTWDIYRTFVNEALLAADTPENKLRRVMNLICDGCHAEAMELLKPVQAMMGAHIWRNVTFDPKFYADLETLTDAEILQSLPGIDQPTPENHIPGEPVVFLACDAVYFRQFAVPMLKSLHAVAPGVMVHIHVMLSEPFTVSLPVEIYGQRVNITTEKLEIGDKLTNTTRRNYYHAIRFVRLWQFMQHYKTHMWMMDVDALFRNDPAPMFAELPVGLAFRARPGRLEPWNQFNASVVGVSPYERSARWLRLVAAYIMNFHKLNMSSWGIDQLAMYGCFHALGDVGPQVRCLNDREVDYDYYDDGIVWCNSGGNKGPHDDRVKYAELFARYAG